MAAHCWLIRPAGAGDRPLCLTIMNSAWASIPGAPARVLDTAEFERATRGEEIWTTGDAAGQIVGFVSLWRADAFVHHLYVSPARHGQGAGSALLRFALDSLHGRLSLKCSDVNRGARRFYERMGGQPVEAGGDDFGPWTRLEFARPA